MMLDVLCVEDDPDIRFILELVAAEQSDICCRFAEDSASAKKLIQQMPPQLMLLDRMLPDQNGLDFLAELQNDRSMPSIPAIIMSARLEDLKVRSSALAGVIGFIEKPFDAPRLFQQVIQIWQNYMAQPG
ncbi:response regulator [Oceanospirillum sanctuarii]|uniref:response regulator n=1 Tax=Oceanospirillum sanctuarii TaxID=1434821 RepID=UPI000A3BED48|nr:response regulator [Oceanospirillum sanctuarii]